MARMVTSQVACAVLGVEERKGEKKSRGRRPGSISKELVEKYAGAATSEAKPGIRVQLARRVAVVYAPSDFEPSKLDGAVCHHLTTTVPGCGGRRRHD